MCVDTHTGPELNSSQKLLQKSAVVGKLTVCVFSPVYEVQSANSTLFISLCIVYSNIGHRAHKSSPGCAKTAPFVCTVLTDSILCPLTSSPQLSLSLPLPLCLSLPLCLLLSAPLCPLEIHGMIPAFRLGSFEKKLFFFVSEPKCVSFGKKKLKLKKNRWCAAADVFPPPPPSHCLSVFFSAGRNYWYEK